MPERERERDEILDRRNLRKLTILYSDMIMKTVNQNQPIR